jgi:secondary thiamine-phosphate synthase enzyme
VGPFWQYNPAVQQTIAIETTEYHEVIDVTQRLVDIVPPGDSICFLFMPHTSAALTLASMEDEAPGDLKAALQQIVPKVEWQHLPVQHAPGHLLSAMIGVTLTIPVQDGKLALGQFQRLVLLEFQGPATRRINADFWNRNGEGA